MDRNQPITTYIRDLLNPLKKHVFPRGGRDEFWGRETVFSQLAKRTPFSWRPADNCSIFFPEVNISEARKEPAKEIIQKLKKIISCQPRPQGAIPWHASLFFSHILLFCPLVLKLQNSSYTLQQWTTKTCAGLSIEFYIMYFAGQGKKLLGKLSNVSELSIFKTALKIWDHIWTVCK